MKKIILLLILFTLFILGGVVLMFVIPKEKEIEREEVKKEVKEEETGEVFPLEFPPIGVLGKIKEIENKTLTVRTENLIGDTVISKQEETPPLYVIQVISKTKIYQFNPFVLPKIPDLQILLKEIISEFATPEDPDDIIRSVKEEIIGEFEEQGKEISPNEIPPEVIKEITFDKLTIGDEIAIICEEEISKKEKFEAIRIILIKN